MSTVTVSKGSSYSVPSGQTDTSDTVLSGGTMFILSGGEVSRSSRSDDSSTGRANASSSRR